MFTHYNTEISRADESIGSLLPLPDATTASPMHFSSPTLQQQHSQLGICELDSRQLNLEVSYYNNNNNNGYSSGSGNSRYMRWPSSLTQRVTSLIQRSVRSHSLHKSNNNNNNNNNNGARNHAFSAFFAELLDSQDDGSVRRVCSTGDLQRINGMQHYHKSDSPLSSETSMIIEGMRRASPYSPEEKKVRIERYRSKRNQRNFGKKIKYASRKTLADSRPRIRGRFVRNDEIVINPPIEWKNVAGVEEEEDENWDNVFNSLVPENLDQEPHCSTSFDVLYYNN